MAVTRLANQGELGLTRIISRPAGFDLSQEAVIDFVDNLKMAGYDRFQ